jgi:hypothetical protein
MGLLDDAIREHLDLKRRRGGDPAEIERAEREALGPVRRGPEDEAPPEFDELHDLPLAEDDTDVVGSGRYDDPFDEDRPFDALDRQPEVYRFEDDLPVEEARSVRLPSTDPGALGRANDDASRPRPAHAPENFEPPGSTGDHGAGGETVEWDVERALQEESAAQDDVLEETPDFLQDAPEHDRLWFEQRPPRDFDFNG